MPIPNAIPRTRSGSYPPFRRTIGWTIPAPSSSSQPVCLQSRQPTPRQSRQWTSTSTLGSVNGKSLPRRRTSWSSPKTEHAELDEDPFQVAHLDVRPDDQPLDLMELDLRTRGNRLVAVAESREDEAYGLRGVLLHRPDLPRRCVGPEQDLGCDVERVLHISGRVVQRHVQEFEVVDVELHVRGFVDRETHGREHVANGPEHLRDRMKAAGPSGTRRQGHVDGLSLHPPRQAIEFNPLLPLRERGEQLVGHEIHPPAELLPSLGRDRADLSAPLVEPAVPRHVFKMPRFDRLRSLRPRELREGLATVLLQIRHVHELNPRKNNKGAFPASQRPGPAGRRPRHPGAARSFPVPRRTIAAAARASRSVVSPNPWLIARSSSRWRRA